MYIVYMYISVYFSLFMVEWLVGLNTLCSHTVLKHTRRPHAYKLKTTFLIVSQNNKNYVELKKSSFKSIKFKKFKNLLLKMER